MLTYKSRFLFCNCLLGGIILVVFSCHETSYYKTNIRQRVDSLWKSSHHLILSDSLELAKKKLKQAIRMAEETDYHHRLADLLYNQGYIALRVGKLDDAIGFLEKSNQAYQVNANIENIIGTDRLLGEVYKRKGRYQSGLYYYNKARDLATTLGDSSLVAVINVVLGDLYHELRQYDLAVFAYQRANSYYYAHRDKGLLSRTANNLGNSYKMAQKYDIAKRYYAESLRLKYELSDSSQLTTTFLNLGELALDEQQPDSALWYLDRAMANQRLFPDTRYAIAIYHLYADQARMVGRYERSMVYIDSAWQMLQTLESRRHLMDHFEKSKKIYQAMGKFQAALQWDHRFDSMNRAFFEEERLKTQEMEANFRLSREKKKGEALEIDNQKQRVWVLVLAILVIIVLTLSLLFYRQRRQLAVANQDLDQKNERIQALNRQNFHFTRNALSEIVSTIRIQANQLDQGPVKDALTTERLRLETINLLYRRLFRLQSDTSDRIIAVSEFIQEIVENTFDSMLPHGHEVSYAFDLVSLQQAYESTLTLGIMINEICINACKYAFSNGHGSFKVAMQEKEGRVTLSLSDTGPGLPIGLDWTTTPSFGMSLIRLLANELSADLDIKSDHSGLSYYFRFSMSKL